jgi:hypothetical protein
MKWYSESAKLASSHNALALCISAQLVLMDVKVFSFLMVPAFRSVLVAFQRGK